MLINLLGLKGLLLTIVMSSTYFHSCMPEMLRSFIIIMKSQGPNLVPCGAPAKFGPLWGSSKYG